MADSTLSLAYNGVQAGTVRDETKPDAVRTGPGVRCAAVLQFRQPGVVEDEPQRPVLESRPIMIAPQDPVAHPKYRPRLQGAAQPIYQFTDTEFTDTQLGDEPGEAGEAVGKPAAGKMEVDIVTFLEAVSSAYPQPGDPVVRPVLRARPARAARAFLYLPGDGEEIAVVGSAKESVKEVVKEKVVVKMEAVTVQASSREAEMQAFQEFLDRIESGPLESLDRPLAEMDAKSEERKRMEVLFAPYDPILEGTVNHMKPWTPGEMQERALIEAVIEPQEPLANQRLPLSPEELLPGVPLRLSPSQRQRVARPVTVRDRHGRLAPVTYSLTPKERS